RKRGRIGKGDPFDGSVCGTVDFYSMKCLATLKFGVFEAQSNAQLVRACELQRCKAIGLLQAGTGTAARLPIEKAAFRGFKHQAIWIIALSSDVGVKSLITKLRDKQSRCADHIAMLEVSLKTALMKVGCGRLSGKGVEAKIVKFLRVKGEG